MFSKTIIALTFAVAAFAIPEAHPSIHKRMALIANAQASCGSSASISCCSSSKDTLIGLNCAEIPILNILSVNDNGICSDDTQVEACCPVDANKSEGTAGSCSAL